MVWKGFMEILAGMPFECARRLTLRSLITRAMLALLASFAWPARAFAAPTREYQVKAVFLFNFAQFVEWPPGTFADATAPIVIGVLGSDPFGNLLEEAVRGETAQGRHIVVKRSAHPKELEECHILFISAKESGRLRGILAELKGKHILTVGESEGFATSGGIIRFMVDRGKIRLRINVEAARDSQLKLSSKLLRPAQIVDSGGLEP
jgi:hypothetical protein